MYTIYFPDDEISVDKDTFFDFISILDKLFNIITILNPCNDHLLFCVSDTDTFYDNEDNFFWSLVGVCSDPDLILQYSL